MRVCVLFSFLVLHCGGAVAKNDTDQPVLGNDDSALKHSLLHTYTSADDGFDTNSFWLSTGSGVVIFDTQFLPEYTHALLDQIAAQTSEAVTDAVVTHGNPDKYNGIAALRQRFPQVRVWATEGTVARIREIDPGKRGYFGPLYGDRYPPTLDLPDQIFAQHTELQVGRERVELFELGGAGVSTNHTVALIKSSGDLVVGDLVHHDTHGWLVEGFSDRWIDRLLEVSLLSASRIAPGRGSIGDASTLVLQQWRYLRTFQNVVCPFANEALTPQSQQAMKEELSARFSTYALSSFIDYSLPAEHARQAALARSGVLSCTTLVEP